jgi:hypothetical protein
LIDTVLDAPVDKWYGYIIVQIGCLYLYSSEVKKPSFSTQLRYDNRQYHLDSSSEMSTGTISFVNYERKVREELRQGIRSLHERSTSLEDKALFNREEEPEVTL